METKTNNINFFKKIYLSIFKIKEYGALAKNGIKKSVYYIMDLIIIFSIIYASILTFQMKKNAEGLKDYLEQNFPNLTYEDNQLKSNLEDAVILDDELVKANFGGQLVIDTTSNYDNLINEYKTKGDPTILFAANKYVTIDSHGIVSEYDYSSIIDTENGESTIRKEYFINMLSNISYSYYFFGYLIGSAIGTSIIVFLYNLLISGCTFIVCKIKKINVKFGEIYSMGLYAHTIAVLGYFIMVFLPTSAAVYVQLLSLLIPIGYLVYAVYLNKWVMPDKS